jgi:hypothetical protein
VIEEKPEYSGGIPSIRGHELRPLYDNAGRGCLGETRGLGSLLHEVETRQEGQGWKREKRGLWLWSHPNLKRFLYRLTY